MIPCARSVCLIPALLALGALGYAQEAGEKPVLRRSFAEVAAPVPPFPEGRFDPRPGETLAWIGGTDVVELDRYGWLEAGLHLAWPERGLRWRNLAWQGDTIYYQARPLYYYTQKGDSQPGSIPDHRERTEPGIVFLCFGKMESLEGESRLEDFVRAYGEELDQLAELTGRLVLVEPTPFLRSGPAAELEPARNAVRRRYAAAIESLARQRGLLYLPVASAADWKAEHSDNGVHLNAAGHRVFAETVLHLLGATEAPPPSPALLDAIELKNRLWQQYYRPTNWAFLFGDRQHVPASRDVDKREERWFVREIDVLPGMIQQSEAEIHRYTKETIR